MIFLNAWAFGLLGLAGVIATLYFLRPREERLTVSALWLWPQEPEHPRSALMFLWTKIWLLLVQLAALAALVFAVAAPTLPSAVLGGGTLALIIDGSASMQTREREQTRYERAVEIAQEIIAQRRPRHLTIIQAQQSPRLLVPWTEDRDRAVALLRASHPTLQSNAPESSVLQLVRSQGELESYDEVIYISDRRPEGDVLTSTVTWVPVGEPRSNFAITAFAARLLPESAQGVALWARVENFSSEAVEGTFTVFAEDMEVARDHLQLAPGEYRSVETIVARSIGGRFRAVLDIEDDFPFDNARYAVMPTRPKLRVLWLGERNFFLERALALFADAQITVLSDADIANTEDYDLVIAHNAELPILPTGRLFFINSSVSAVVRLSESSGATGAPQFLQPGHALVQNLRLEHFQASRVRSAEFALPVQTLLVLDGHPILAAHRSSSLSLVWLGIDLRASPLVLTPSFPILVRNVTRWLFADLTLLGERFVSEEFPNLGFTEQGAINLDPRESQEIRVLSGPSSVPPAAGQSEQSRHSLGARGQSLWHYGAWLALGLLVLELLWHDRRLLRRSL
ncbi:MAG: BatA and WFA domain-containing protein [Candidatus Bipolaricaulota bacterium]|nr:BatA and WFA domain-containing protein [Candidatus Bipolaricaulota bacterium]